MTDLTVGTVSDEPILLSKTDVEGVGKLKMTIERKYTPPLDGTKDQLDTFDNWIARRVAEILVKYYHGYEWHVMAESRQGIVTFCIPELMGQTLRWVIRLGEYKDLTPELIRRCGGELLERMGLRRGPIDVAEYAAARQRLHTFDFADVKR